MGQYYKVFNKTKKEYLTPHTFGNGFKLMEFTSDGRGILQGLSLLLANGNGRGGGDHHSDSEIIGRWSGDNITIDGDYADDTLWAKLDKDGENYEKGWKDISKDVYRVLLQDSWIGKEMEERLKKDGDRFLYGEELELMQELFPTAIHEGNLRQKFDFVEKSLKS